MGNIQTDERAPLPLPPRPERCVVCGGVPYFLRVESDAAGWHFITIKCGACNGTGRAKPLVGVVRGEK